MVFCMLRGSEGFLVYIVTCQAHPVLVKKGESNVRFVPFKIFI